MAPKADTPVEALNLQAYQQWLREDMTQLFFATLQDRYDSMTKAACRNAGRTGLNNALEHNNLVKSAELLYLLETYAKPSHYPFTHSHG